MTGRKSDPIWKFFEKKVIPERKGCRAICQLYKQSMEGQIKRMQVHYEKCSAERNRGKLQNIYCIVLSTVNGISLQPGKTNVMRKIYTVLNFA